MHGISHLSHALSVARENSKCLLILRAPMPVIVYYRASTVLVLCTPSTQDSASACVGTPAWGCQHAGGALRPVLASEIQ